MNRGLGKPTETLRRKWAKCALMRHYTLNSVSFYYGAIKEYYKKDTLRDHAN